MLARLLARLGFDRPLFDDDDTGDVSAAGDTRELDEHGDPTSPLPENDFRNLDDDAPMPRGKADDDDAPDEADSAAQTESESDREPIADGEQVQGKTDEQGQDEFVEEADERGDKFKLDKRAQAHMRSLREENERLRRQFEAGRQQPTRTETPRQETTDTARQDETDDPDRLLIRNEARRAMEEVLTGMREKAARAQHEQQTYDSRSKAVTDWVETEIAKDGYLSRDEVSADEVRGYVKSLIANHREHVIRLDEGELFDRIRSDFNTARGKEKAASDRRAAIRAAKDQELAKARADSARQGQPQPTGARKGTSTSKQAEAPDWAGKGSKGFNETADQMARRLDEIFRG